MSEVLQFEREWEGRAGSKSAAIRDAFGVSAARYYVWLNQALDDPAAVQLDPVLVHRLIRLRDLRAAARANREYRRL
jgi:hypothetical protein